MYALTRAAYFLLWLLAVVAQVPPTFKDLPYNYVWYVTAPEALGFAASFAVMIYVFSAVLAERKLKIRQYKSIHLRFPVFAIIGAGIHLLTALCMVLYILINHASAAGIWWPPVRMFIAAICFLALNVIERKLEYDIEENPSSPVPGGVEIH